MKSWRRSKVGTLLHDKGHERGKLKRNGKIASKDDFTAVDNARMQMSPLTGSWHSHYIVMSIAEGFGKWTDIS